MTALEQFYNAIGRVPPPAQADLVRFNKLAFEHGAAQESSGSQKTLFYQGSAAAHLATRGLRLPRMREIFAEVILPGIDGKLTSRQQEVLDDMLAGYGEWTGDLILTQGDTLYLAEGTVAWDGQKYDNNQVHATSATTYDITGLPRQQYLPLQDVSRVNPAIVTALYSKPLQNLPSEIQNGAGIWLPPEGAVRPVGCGVFVDDGNGAARGVQRIVP